MIHIIIKHLILLFIFGKYLLSFLVDTEEVIVLTESIYSYILLISFGNIFCRFLTFYLLCFLKSDNLNLLFKNYFIIIVAISCVNYHLFFIIL